MKKLSKKGLMLFSLGIIFAIAVVLIPWKNVEAQTNLFTLGAVPQVNREVNVTNSVNVSTPEQYISALQNQSVNEINFNNDIIFSTIGMGYSITRDLVINGNGHTLRVFGNASFGPTTGTGSRGGTHLILEGTGGTFHLKNLVLERVVTGSGQNDFVSILTENNQLWDIILDDFDFSFPDSRWRVAFAVPAGTVNTARVFFRNNSIIDSSTANPININGDVVFEPNSNTILHGFSRHAVLGIIGGNTNIYVDSNATTNIRIPTQIWSGSRGSLAGINTINVYPNATLTVAGTGNETIGGIMSQDALVPMTFRVDTDATFKVENSLGSAIMSTVENPIKILGNPGSSVELIGNSTNPASRMTYANSQIQLSSPKYFNLQNNGTGIAYTGVNNITPTLKLLQTNVGVWNRGTNLTQPPLTPSPFANVDVFAGSNGALSGSSAILSTLPPSGWNTANYSKIAFAQIVEINASDMTIGLDRTVSADINVNPANTTLTYSSSNESIATVSADGKVTGHAVGNATITINGTSVDAFPSSSTFEVTVTNTPPVLTVPSFSTVDLNGAFNPMTGVSAIDQEDGDITNDVVVTGNVDTGVAGTYTLDYSITDFNNNTVTARQVVVVKDGTTVVGDNVIIQATDFSKRVGQVDTSSTAILQAANVQVNDKNTGEILTNEPVSVTETNGYGAVVGTYGITFKVDSDPKATISIVATVYAGQKPTITVNPPVLEVGLGSNFDPLVGVSATDTEDGDFNSNEIVVNNPVITTTAGVYVVTYSVTDSDGNNATASRRVIVQDDSFVVGNSKIIRATDFTKRPSQVIVSDVAIKQAANVQVYDKNTGQLLANEPITIIDSDDYSDAIGTYKFTFEVTSDPLAKQEITANVVPGENPVLSVNPTFVTVDLNDTFDVMDGVSASDYEDGDITSSVHVNNPVLTSVAGVYLVTYSITDSDGNKAQATRTVLVQDNNFVVGDRTIIKAFDFSKRISEVDTSDAAIKTAAGVQVYDKFTGDIIANEPVTVADTGGYTNVAGSYNIRFEVTSDTNASITITADVENGQAPVLTVPTYTKVDLNGSFDPMLGVSAIDYEDGDITANVVIESTNVNTTVVGIYRVEYSITDLDGNRKQASQTVVVSDGQMVVGNENIIFAEDFTKRVGEVDTSSNAIRMAANARVYDLKTGEINNDAIVNVVDLGGYHAAVGTYTIVFEVSGDTATRKSITASVVTGQSPVLSVPAFRETPQNQDFDLLTGVSANDYEDGDITSNITIVGEFDKTIPGPYIIQYNVVDSDGNRASAEGVILVSNDEFGVGNNTIIQAANFTKRISEVNTSSAAIIAAANVKLYDKVTGVEIENPEITVVDNGGYTNTPGTYNIVFAATNDLAATITIEATVVAAEDPILNVPSFVSINVGDTSFDPWDQVSATDPVYGDFDQSDIVKTGNVDINTPGVYALNFRVSNIDGASAEATKVVLVKDPDDNFNVGDNHILYAEDFTRRVSQVDTSDVAVFDAAGVRVFDKKTGAELTVADVQITSLGGYSATPGTYDITFEVINDPSTTATSVATVVRSEPPILNVPALTEVAVEADFDPMSGVSATSSVDGDLTRFIRVSGQVNVNVAGVYNLTYTVSDLDGNEVSARRVVVVGDGELVVGERTILYADNFTKRVGQVDPSDDAILAAANIRVYDKDSGLEIPNEPVRVVYNGGYTSTPGVYAITLEVISDPSAQKIITGTVVTGEKPILSVDPTFVEVPINGTFNKLDGVSAIDSEDGDITNLVTTDIEINTSVAGVYTVNYSIIDSDLNSASVSRTVLVKDDSFVVGDRFILQANDFTKRVGQVDTSLAAIKDAAGVIVFDKVTGQVVNETVNITNLGGYKAEVGQYVIDLQVASDSLASTSITANVITGDIPVLNVATFTEINVNDAFNPMDGVSAIDTEDGDISNKIIVTGSVDNTVAGVYPLTYSITDSDGNNVTQKRVVLVNDNQFGAGSTSIITASNFSKLVTEVNLDESVIKMAANVRIYDKTTGLIDNTKTIEILDLGGYKAEVGTYTITFGVKEDVNATITVEARVNSNTAPVLTVPTFSEVAINKSFDKMAGVSAIDVEDGDITNKIKVSGTVNTAKAGVYILTYEVVDSHNNKVSAKQTVLVNDGFYAYGNGKIINAYNFTVNLSNANLSDKELIKLAKVRIYDVNTQTWTPYPNVTVDRGEFGTKPGVFSIKFIYNPTITIKATIKDDSDKLKPLPKPNIPNGGINTNVIPIIIIIGLTTMIAYRRYQLK